MEEGFNGIVVLREIIMISFFLCDVWWNGCLFGGYCEEMGV